MESEPVIVVDQENCINEEDEDLEDVAGSGQGCPDTPPQDPFFLSPFRDMRKRSLPTPQCTSGITASQVINDNRLFKKRKKKPYSKLTAKIIFCNGAKSCFPEMHLHVDYVPK